MSVETRILLGSLAFIAALYLVFTWLALAMVDDLKHHNGEGLANWWWKR